MPTIEDAQDWNGRHMVGPGDERLGKIDGIYVDDASGEPMWALVHTGLVGRRSTFVPIADARLRGDDVHVPFDKATIKDAPGIDPDEHVTPEQEAELHRFYGTRDDEHDAGARGRSHDALAHDPDAMVLSEEQVQVTTRELPATKVRMRKHVITEEVTITVPVTREEVRLEEVPADAPDLDPSETPTLDDSGAAVLHSEVPVVQTRSVETERVRLGKDAVTRDVDVTAPVRREQVDVDGTGVDARPTTGRRGGDEATDRRGPDGPADRRGPAGPRSV